MNYERRLADRGLDLILQLEGVIYRELMYVQLLHLHTRKCLCHALTSHLGGTRSTDDKRKGGAMMCLRRQRPAAHTARGRRNP
jgi:hypothetical protein